MRDYWKSRWRQILLIPVLLLLYGTVAVLGGLAEGTALYGLLLCLCAAVAALFWNLGRFLRQRRTVREADLVLGPLPAPADALEGDYQAVIEALRRRLRETEDEDNRRLRELTEDLTLWAHQMKTPLAAAQLLLPEEPERAAEELLRIEQYVQTLLGVLRLDSDSTDYVLREIAVDQVIRGVVRKYSATFIRKRLALEYEGTPLRVVSDEKWLSFVLEQLLSNALKYTDSGSIRLWTEGSLLCLEDTGIGIAPEDLPRVFDKGFTGYNGRSDKRATGIGLYLCRRILDQLGHRIEITSTVGKGTRVTVDLSRESDPDT